MTKDTTRPMTAEEYWKDKFPAASENNLVLGFADAYANYRLAFEKEQQPKTIKGSLWYCETCKSTVDAVNVTYEETHDVRAGGCGGRVVPDPYWSDPATWPEWANWRAVGEDGCVYFSSILMEANTLYGSWSTSIYAASKMVPRAVNHNPDWRNSLRSREEVSDGK